MSSGPNLILSTPAPSLNSLGPLSWQLPSLRNMRPTSRLETGAQHISWSQGHSISRSLPRCPCLVARVFFLLSLSTSLPDIVLQTYTGSCCVLILMSRQSAAPSSRSNSISLTDWTIGRFTSGLPRRSRCLQLGTPRTPVHPRSSLPLVEPLEFHSVDPAVTPYKHLGKISDILHLNNENNQLERRAQPPKDVPLDA